MDTSKVKNALQDLIIRLQDAEKGFSEIDKATSIMPLKKWLSRYSKERHEMHKALEIQMTLLGGDADVKTSFLGDLHRAFIDIKINSVSYDGEFNAIVTEIERGSTRLIEDYTKVIDEVQMPSSIKDILISQRNKIRYELTQMQELKDELESAVA